MVFFICGIFNFYLALYSTSETEGNPLVSMLTFISAEALGVLSVPFVVKIFSIKTGVVFGCLVASAALFVKNFLKVGGPTEQMMTLLIAYALGMNVNFATLINNTLIDFKLRFISYEFNYCMAQTLTMLAPIFAIKPEPVPTYVIWGLLGTVLVVTLSMQFEEQSKTVSNIKEMINNSIANSLAQSQLYAKRPSNVVSQWKPTAGANNPTSSDSDD